MPPSALYMFVRSILGLPASGFGNAPTLLLRPQVIGPTRRVEYEALLSHKYIPHLL